MSALATNGHVLDKSKTNLLENLRELPFHHVGFYHFEGRPQNTWKKRSGERNMDSRFQVQLEEEAAAQDRA